MKESTKNKLFIFILIPIAIYFFIVGPIILYTSNISNSIDYTLKILQSLAILIGGFWGYFKFGWEKKCENIIQLKEALMIYEHVHSLNAAKYLKNENLMEYKLNMLNQHNEFIKKVHLSYYVNKELRKKILETVWLVIGNNTNKHNIKEQWAKFGNELKNIYDEFDKIIDL